MRDGKIVVLQVIGGLSMGGAESRIMDIARHIDRSKFDFDFLLDEPEGYYEPEAKKLGSNIYRVPRFRLYNWPQYASAMKKFFSEHKEIDIVQGSLTSTASIYMPIAKKCGVPVTMAYARSAGVDPGPKGTVTKMLRKNLWKKCDHAAAVSSEAGEAVFGKERLDHGDVMIMPGAMPLDKFCYAEHEAEGQAIREKFGLGCSFVIGHVGRFHYAKNHEFLIEVFKEIKKKRTDAKLLLAGNGPTFEAVKKKAADEGVSDDVVFAGETGNPAPMYMAADMLIFPSHYEGLPGTVIEAQAAGLPCLISDAISKEAAVTELVERFSLDKSASEWADEALKLFGTIKDRYPLRQDINMNPALSDAGFEIVSSTKKLEALFEKLLKDANG
ncbi:MAG: glycosyltransferase [Lachnospiraceae bacterium]|nr:glycosyltransferase [Lachnospiraceae bacterium]